MTITRTITFEANDGTEQEVEVDLEFTLERSRNRSEHFGTPVEEELRDWDFVDWSAEEGLSPADFKLVSPAVKAYVDNNWDSIVDELESKSDV